MAEFDGEWVLVGVSGDGVKVVGPFQAADEARGMANTIGVIPGVTWMIAPLQTPG